MSGQHRLVSTEDLKIISKTAKNKGLSSLPRDLSERLDPDGKHVLWMRLWGHNMERPGEKLWHRVGGMVKVIGSDEGVPIEIEIFDEQWKRLIDADEWLAEA